MSGKDKSREITIVGGTYREACYWPVWNELYGSGWRAARVIRAFCPDVKIKFHTAGGTDVMQLLKVYAASEKLEYERTNHRKERAPLGWDESWEYHKKV